VCKWHANQAHTAVSMASARHVLERPRSPSRDQHQRERSSDIPACAERAEFAHGHECQCITVGFRLEQIIISRNDQTIKLVNRKENALILHAHKRAKLKQRYAIKLYSRNTVGISKL
jgi:hypothetical protein